MLRPRIIPCLLVHKGGLVKTQGFKDGKYVGDPINAVKIFNEKEADELIVLDIDATVHGREPDFALIAKLAAETLASLQASGGKLVGDLPVAEASKIVLAMEGDAGEGKQIFTRQSCIACHSILPDEPQKGPYLGSVGNLFNREQLIQHIIDPAAEVAQGFQTYQFKLKDGTLASGFVTARDDNTITLRNLAGLSQTIQASAVEKEEVLDVSMMPAGLVDSLTLRQFASLIDYLQTLH